LHALIDGCLAQVQGNEDGVSDDTDPEYVHQMRVGMRRLRLVVRLFRGVAPCPEPLTAELKWLATELGQARDWEVFAGSTLPAIERVAPPAELELLRVRANETARRHRAAAADAVRSARYTRLLLDLARWLQAVESVPDPEMRAALQRPLRKFAAELLRSSHKRLLMDGAALRVAPARCGTGCASPPEGALCDEFFESLYPQRACASSCGRWLRCRRARPAERSGGCDAVAYSRSDRRCNAALDPLSGRFLAGSLHSGRPGRKSCGTSCVT
jgi:hypothetical protein